VAVIPYAEEIFREGQKRRLAWGYIATPGEVLEMEHLAAREYFPKMQHPDGFMYRMPGAPFRMSKTPWRQGRAPTLNEHRGAPSAFAKATADKKVAAPAASKQVLAGMRVLDLTHDWAGPHTGRMLGDHGADVFESGVHRSPGFDARRRTGTALTHILAGGR